MSHLCSVWYDLHQIRVCRVAPTMSERGGVIHLPTQPRSLGPRKVNKMASNATPARREGLLRATRKVIEANREVFTEAGKRLTEIFSENHLKQDDHDGKWAEKSSEELIFPRLDRAKVAVVSDEYPNGYSDMRFEEPMPHEERKLAASMVVLTLVLAIDPNANEYISKSMCPFAALPWQFGEEVPGLLGRGMICWENSEHNSVDSPPGEVLDLLERATWSARTGEVMPVGMTIPTGDGQPCDEPGINPYDELSRAMRDVQRHIRVFQGNASEWADVIQHEHGEDLKAKKIELLEDNRKWWATWEPALRRARDATFQIHRPELQDRIRAAMDGMNTLALNIFPPPLMGMKNELPGDHLLKRGALRCDREGHSVYPQKAISEAYRPIEELIVGLALYIDGTVEEQKKATSGSERLFSSSAVERRNAAWFSSATDGGLYADLLRVAANDGRLKRSLKVSDRWHHSIIEVYERYPEYKTAIKRAKESEGAVSKPKN